MLKKIKRVYKTWSAIPKILGAIRNNQEALLLLSSIKETDPAMVMQILGDYHFPLDKPSVRSDFASGKLNLLRPIARMRDALAASYSNMARDMPSLSPAEAIQLLDQSLHLAVLARADICAQAIQFASYFLGGELDVLLRYCKEFLSIRGCWEPKFAYVWAIYIDALNRAGDTDMALYLLKKHKDIHNMSEIFRLPRTALFAEEHGITNQDIKISASVAREIQQNSGYLAELLGTGSVAVVGNGPQEQGKGRGKYIDAHDIVIRFGKFVGIGANREDYGAKTDILCWHKYLPAEKEVLPPDIHILLTEFEGHYIQKDSLQALGEYIKQKRKVMAISQDFLKKITEANSYCHPSSGLMVAALILSLRMDLGRSNFYAFSQLDPEAGDDWGTHFFDLSGEEDTLRYLYGHNLIEERVIFQKLFRDK